MLAFLHGKTIQTGASVLGFEEHTAFEISVEEDNADYAFLQSVSNESVGFFTANPFALNKEYAFEIPPEVVTELSLHNPEEVAVLGIITLRDTLEASTVNMLAPVIINTQTLQARQVVLPPHYDFSTRAPLLVTPKDQGGDETGC